VYFVIRCDCSACVKTEAGLALANWVHGLDVVTAKLTGGCSGSSGREERHLLISLPGGCLSLQMQNQPRINQMTCPLVKTEEMPTYSSL